MLKLTSTVSLLILLASVSQADEDDFEFEFFIKQKSTISDFPFQEIGQDELSEAAIDGALKASSAGIAEKKGKPAYAEQQDDTEKQQQSELEPIEIVPNEDDLLRFSQNNSLAPAMQGDPFYNAAGRNYEGHSFNAVER